LITWPARTRRTSLRCECALGHFRSDGDCIEVRDGSRRADIAGNASQAFPASEQEFYQRGQCALEGRRCVASRRTMPVRRAEAAAVRPVAAAAAVRVRTSQAWPGPNLLSGMELKLRTGSDI
jgi:hypothetical protein